jgi:hypothetical protein
MQGRLQTSRLPLMRAMQDGDTRGAESPQDLAPVLLSQELNCLGEFILVKSLGRR